VLFTLAILLMLAWKVAGWYGLDRFLLPRIGAPWTWRREQTMTRPPTTPQPTPTA
jgi:thiosulfate dehydrogenase (quinone) large subunit